MSWLIDFCKINLNSLYKPYLQKKVNEEQKVHIILKLVAMRDYPISARIQFCIPLNYGAQGACCYPHCPFVKAASPLLLITQTGNDAQRPQLLPVSTKNTVMNVAMAEPEF